MSPRGIALGCCVVVSRNAARTGTLLTPPQVVKLPLRVVQTAAVLEIVHAATGLVRAPLFTTRASGAPTALSCRTLVPPDRSASVHTAGPKSRRGVVVQ